MTLAELKGLRVGDRVRWTHGLPAVGTVTERLSGVQFRIAWVDGVTEVLNPRNRVDVSRARNIALVRE